jgi:uncharacterized protein with HEPN domain
MARDPRAYLWDVREAGRAILSFTQDMDLLAFSSHLMAQASVERKFEVIGEALNQLSRVEPALAARIPDLSKIVAFRNLLIHGYASVQVATVWNTIESSLPAMLDRVDALLEELG